MVHQTVLQGASAWVAAQAATVVPPLQAAHSVRQAATPTALHSEAAQAEAVLSETAALVAEASEEVQVAEVILLAAVALVAEVSVAAQAAEALVEAAILSEVAVVREAPSGVAAQVAEAVSADNDWKHNGLT